MFKEIKCYFKSKQSCFFPSDLADINLIEILYLYLSAYYLYNGGPWHPKCSRHNISWPNQHFGL